MFNRLIPFLTGRVNDYSNIEITVDTINTQGQKIVTILIIAGFSIVTGSGLVRILQAIVRHDKNGAAKEAIDHLFGYLVIFLFMIGMYAIRRYFG